ncbi:BLUF domain-containing protein [Natronohydrobacter thiooxidans]|jgi:hypothetical protein|uniref:BLUF domain-containing protein n=1 Tax=Natronohydrobacter thiooxidans TaxID=87172 RepID=UPI0008FF5DA0|nr:BLUF domain-containing protein [Natronohydrobacter thiooxidans]
MAQLSECIYLSRSLIAPHSVDLLDIGRAALRNNPQHGISGCLYVDSTFFAQLLEGPLPTLHRLLAILRRDRRHVGMLILRERPLTQRRFEHWSMKIIDGTAAGVSPHLSALPDALREAEAGDATRLLRQLDAFATACAGN